MPDRRPWPSTRMPEAIRAAAQRADRVRSMPPQEVVCLMRGLQMAHRAAVDAVEELYDAADARSGADRTEGLARAAGAKLVAARLQLLIEAAKTAGAAPAPRRGLAELLKALGGGAAHE